MGETAHGGVVCQSREPVNVKITKYINSEKGFLTIIVTNPIKICLDNTSSYPPFTVSKHLIHTKGSIKGIISIKGLPGSQTPLFKPIREPQRFSYKTDGKYY